MSRPPFSRKRKGKTVDPYPLRDKGPSKSSSTKRSGPGRPRKPTPMGGREILKSKKKLDRVAFFQKEEHRHRRDAIVWADYWESVGYQVEVVRRKNSNWYGLEDGYIYEIWVKEIPGELKVPGRTIRSAGSDVDYTQVADLYGMTMDEFNILVDKQPHWVGRMREGTEVYAIMVGEEGTDPDKAEYTYYSMGRSENEARKKLERVMKDQGVEDNLMVELQIMKLGKMEDLEPTEQYEMLRHDHTIGIFERG